MSVGGVSGRNWGRLAWTIRPARWTSKVTIEPIPSFNASGMADIYGRGDHFPRLPCYNMSIWVAKCGRVFARFWSRGSYVTAVSYELHNFKTWPEVRRRLSEQNEEMVPRVLRCEYEDRVIDRVEYPYE